MADKQGNYCLQFSSTVFFSQNALQIVKFFQGKHQRKEANQDNLGKFRIHRPIRSPENMAPYKLKNFSQAS